jgi:hypothetical protein
MSGQEQIASVQPLLTSKYFPRHEQRDFRIWKSVTRQQLTDMVAATPAVAALDADTRAELLAQAAAIHAPASAVSQMQLPYQLRCWRVQVDHAELTAPIQLGDSGLIISL